MSFVPASGTRSSRSVLTLAALWFVDAERTLVGYLILAELLALALEPAVIWMHEHHGWRRGSATGLLLVGVLLALVLLIAGTAAVLARETTLVVHNLPDYLDKLNTFTQGHFNFTAFSATQTDAAGQASTHVQDFLKQHQEDILGGIASGISGIFTLFTVGLFTFYLTAQSAGAEDTVLSDAPRATGTCALRMGDGDQEDGWVPLLAPAAGRESTAC